MVQLPEPVVQASGWIVLLTLVVLMLFMSSAVRKYRRNKGSHHAPASKPAAHHDPHHASGGDHGHDDHHPKKTFLEKAFWVLVGLLVLALLGLLVIWLHSRSVREIQNNTTYSVGRAETALAIAARSSGVTVAQPVCPPLADDIPTVVTAPSKDGDWYFVDVPVCHRALFCDKANDPECKPMEAADERFDMVCKDQKDRPQQHSTICRVRSKSADPVELAVSYEFTGML